MNRLLTPFIAASILSGTLFVSGNRATSALPETLSCEKKELQKILSHLSRDAPVTLAATELGWRYRLSEDGKLWVAGLTQFSRGVAEIYIKAPLPQTEEAQIQSALGIVVERGGIDSLPKNRFGYAVHIERPDGRLDVYQILDMRKLDDPEARNEALPAQLRLAADYRDFVINGYRHYRDKTKNMKIEDTNLERLRSISEAVEKRSILFVKTREPYLRFDRDTQQIIIHQEGTPLDTPEGRFHLPLNRSHPDHFTIEGGGIAVISRSADEPLPLELYTGFQVPRSGEGATIELGRYYVDGAVAPHDSALRIKQLMASIAVAGGKKVDQIVIEADAVRARRFERDGFKSIHDFVNAAGVKEQVMTVSPEEFLSRLTRPGPEEPITDLLLSRPLDAFIAAVEFTGPDSKYVSLIGTPSVEDLALQKIRDILASPAPRSLKESEIVKTIKADAHMLLDAGVDAHELATHLLNHSADQPEDLNALTYRFCEPRIRQEALDSFFEKAKHRRNLNRLFDRVQKILDSDTSEPEKKEKVQRELYSSWAVFRRLGGDRGFRGLYQALIDPVNSGRPAQEITEKYLQHLRWDDLTPGRPIEPRSR